MAKILIVEDDQDFRTILETMIRLEGHDVFLAANGETGLSQAKNRKPEIVLTDIEMPGLNGIDMTRKLRADAALAHAYIILITGQGGQEAKLDGLRAGADDFLVKPSSGAEILGRLEIAQKVLAVQAQQREVQGRLDALAAGRDAVAAELTTLDQYLMQAEESIQKKDAKSLAAAVKAAQDSLKKALEACGGEEAPAPADGWL